MSTTNPSPLNLTGVILSGGISSRFQKECEAWQDKALIMFDKDQSLLEKTILSLSKICSELLIIVNNSDRKLAYQKFIAQLPISKTHRIKIEIDNKSYLCSGPTLGLLSSFDHIITPLAIVVPVDVPLISSSIISELLNNLKDSSIVVPFWRSSGKIEPLIFAFNPSKIRQYVSFLGLIKRSRADDIFRVAPSINFLPIAQENEEQANSVLMSINNPSKLMDLRNKMKVLNEAEINFDSINSIKNNIDVELLTNLTDFLTDNSFFVSNESLLEKGKVLAHKLLTKKMYFHAGILLYTLIESLPAKIINEHKALVKLLCKMGLEAFEKEGVFWKNLGINFLELHTYTDALKLSDKISAKPINKMKNRIKDLKEQMNMSDKNHHYHNFTTLFKERAPNFLIKARSIIQEAEVSFNKEEPKFETDFLWDHSYRVGKIAFKLAQLEGVDPFIPTIAAILHDAGKFILGKYHQDRIIEEEHSASIAEKLLMEEGISSETITSIITAITALYNERLDCTLNCKIVHDADRLDKLGIFGISNFFVKLALRGINLSKAIMQTLSKELTYASMAPYTLFTESGRTFAKTRSKKTLDFFYELLEEISFYDISKYHIKKFEIKDTNVLLIIPDKCENCSVGSFNISLSTKLGIKCETLKALYSCTNCDEEFSLEFCLPLLIKK
ncbi:MAG: NTP transferase domain-containing protein [Candidatus Heimdallarchaeota archaeon]|nr:NTP transferase domain-containing protein [Candidatus Heimdallarchaeota archaeon]